MVMKSLFARVSALMLLFFLGVVFQAHAADIYVPGDYSTVVAAVAAAADGDTIHVGTGTFAGFSTNKILTIVGNGPTSTILSGYGSSAETIYLYYSLYVYGTYQPGILNLQNLTVTGGTKTGIKVNASRLNLLNCVVRNNGGTSGYPGGGGIYGYYSSDIRIEKSIIRNNTHSSAAAAVLCDCSQKYTQALCIAKFNMVNSLVYDNTVTSGSNAVKIVQGTMYPTWPTECRVNHCVLAYNTSYVPVLHVQGDQPEDMEIVNSIILASTDSTPEVTPGVSISYSCLRSIYCDFDQCPGMVFTPNPNFHNAGSRNFRFSAASLCVDTGIASEVTDDFENIPRTFNDPNRITMGPYERCSVNMGFLGPQSVIRCLPLQGIDSTKCSDVFPGMTVYDWDNDEDEFFLLDPSTNLLVGKGYYVISNVFQNRTVIGDKIPDGYVIPCPTGFTMIGGGSKPTWWTIEDEQDGDGFMDYVNNLWYYWDPETSKGVGFGVFTCLEYGKNLIIRYTH